MKRILVLVHDMANNTVGRAYSLWLLAQHLGLEMSVAGPVRSGRGLWAPLRGSAFSEHCVPIGGRVRRNLTELAERADAIVAIKATRRSFDFGRKICRALGVPLLLDIDDPTLEVQYSELSWVGRLGFPRPDKLLHGAHPYMIRQRARRVQRVTKIVSNPVLQERWGGVIVPHVRRPGPEPTYSDTHQPVIGFIGTPREHKGHHLLRNVTDALASRGWELVVTAEPPGDTRPWERWVGTTTFEEGQQLLRQVDVVAVPSLPHRFGDAQLPVKLIDAMMAGRAVVGSNLRPIRWALEDNHQLAAPGDIDDWLRRLRTFEDPLIRKRLGKRNRTIARQRFAPEVVASSFLSALRSSDVPD